MQHLLSFQETPTKIAIYIYIVKRYIKYNIIIASQFDAIHVYTHCWSDQYCFLVSVEYMFQMNIWEEYYQHKLSALMFILGSLVFVKIVASI